MLIVAKYGRGLFYPEKASFYIPVIRIKKEDAINQHPPYYYPYEISITQDGFAIFSSFLGS